MAKTFLNKKNNAKSTITDNPLTSGATTVNVQTGDGSKFPNAPFHATLYSNDPASGEIVKITVKSTDQFTIERAKESTSAQEWAQGTKLELLITAQLLNDFQTRTEIIVATDGSGDYNCDGSSDETEINEAVTDLPSGGGIVHLKKGTYTIDGIISILKSGVTIEGEGPATIIKAANSSELNRLIGVGDGGSVSYSDICIKNLTVDGNGVNQSTGNSSPIVIWGTDSYLHKRVTIENCWLTGSKLDCLKLLKAEECIIKGNHFYSNTGTAIFNNHDYNTIVGNTSYNNGYFYYGSACNYNTISGNVSTNDSYGIYISSGWRDSITGNIICSFTNYGISLMGSQRITVNGNHVYGGSYGILIGNSSGITQYNCITGNTLAWQSTRAIAIYAGSGGCINNVVSGNAIYGPGQQGIYIYRSSYNSITGNTIDGAGRSTTNSYDSIFITDDGVTYSTYNIISSNNLQAQQTNKARYHVRENSSSDDYNLVIGNICKDGATGQISLQGTNSVRGTNIPSSG